MKKLLSTLLCLSVVIGIAPLSSSAVSEPIYIENGAENWSKTVVAGDIDDDGHVRMSDLVILHKCFMNGNVSPDDYEGSANIMTERLDVNFDGSFDVFDMVLMRQFVIHPETAPVQKWAIDTIKIDTLENEGFSLSESGEIITTYADYQKMLEFFNAFEDNNLTEVLEKNQRYDEQFFEENNLILKPFRQERGNGIFYNISGVGKFNNVKLFNSDEYILDGICFGLQAEYKQDKGLYPVTNTPMLAQITVPKSQSSADDKVTCLDVYDIFKEQKETCSYTSPDGQHEIVITNREFGLWGDDITVYLKNSDGSFTYLTDIGTDDLGTPFTNNDELLGDGYNIEFGEDSLTIDYYFGNGYWKKVQVSYEGEFIDETSYEK